MKQLIVVLGATAVGKTKFSIELAEFLKTEIISGDSRQFFKEMTIGTAVPSSQELQRVPHHFIQHKSIHQNYTAGDYEKESLQTLEERFKHYDKLILTGGSSLYIDALLYGLDVFPEVDIAIRQELDQQLKNEGIETLQKQLQKLDEVTHHQIDIQNPRRLVRALEVCIASGKPFSSFKGIRNKTKRNFKIIKIGLNIDRQKLYENINKRVLRMMANGLEEETKKLYPVQGLNALQTVGYKELFCYFDGKTSLEQAIEDIQKNTRRYAKRQLTWLRKDNEIHWNSPFDSQTEYIEKLTRG